VREANVIALLHGQPVRLHRHQAASKTAPPSFFRSCWCIMRDFSPEEMAASRLGRGTKAIGLSEDELAEAAFFARPATADVPFSGPILQTGH